MGDDEEFFKNEENVLLLITYYMKFLCERFAPTAVLYFDLVTLDGQKKNRCSKNYVLLFLTF